MYKSYGTIYFTTEFTELNVSKNPLWPGEGEAGTYDDIIFIMTAKNSVHFSDGIEISGNCMF